MHACTKTYMTYHLYYFCKINSASLLSYYPRNVKDDWKSALKSCQMFWWSLHCGFAILRNREYKYFCITKCLTDSFLFLLCSLHTLRLISVVGRVLCFSNIIFYLQFSSLNEINTWILNICFQDMLEVPNSRSLSWEKPPFFF